jgi:hypothetical protein
MTTPITAAAADDEPDYDFVYDAAAAAEAEAKYQPTRFLIGDRELVVPHRLMWPSRVAVEVESTVGDRVLAGFRQLLGDDAGDFLAGQPEHVVMRIVQHVYEKAGLIEGESRGSAKPSRSTTRRSRRTSPSSTR